MTIGAFSLLTLVKILLHFDSYAWFGSKNFEGTKNFFTHQNASLRTPTHTQFSMEQWAPNDWEQKVQICKVSQESAGWMRQMSQLRV